MKRTLVILNPGAGSADGHADVVRLAAEKGVDLRETSGPDDAPAWARDAAGHGYETVVAAGGDGTVHEVVRGLLEGEGGAALGILPLGTGNDLARSLGIPLELEDAIETLRTSRPRSMDVLRVTLDGEERICANVANGGFAGKVQESADDHMKEFWGPLSYLRASVDAWGELTPFSVQLQVDGQETDHRALNVVVANGRFAGGGLPVAPSADPFDGLLDVVIVPDLPSMELAGWLPALVKGEPPDDDRYVTTRGREVVLRSEPPMPISVDGELRTAEEARFEVLPRAIQVRSPG